MGGGMGSSYPPPPSGRAKKKFWYVGVVFFFVRPWHPGGYKSCEGGSLVEVPASSKPVFIAPHTPPAPHNDITSPSKCSTSITTQPSRVRTRGRCGCATIARPGRPSLGCAVVGYYYCCCCCCCVFFRICRHTHPCSRLWLCVSPPARPCCFTHHVCVSRFLFQNGRFSIIIFNTWYWIKF